MDVSFFLCFGVLQNLVMLNVFRLWCSVSNRNGVQHLLSFVYSQILYIV